MIKTAMIFIVSYSFVIITSMQLFVNLIFLFAKDFYIENSFFFSNMVGFSLISLIPLVSVAFLFKFCMPSRICAVAQIIMTAMWLFIQEDNAYNIGSQIIIGTIALVFSHKKIKRWFGDKIYRRLFRRATVE